MMYLLLFLLALQEPRELARDRGLNVDAPRDVEPPGLWYGTPGLRPEGNLLELFRKPGRRAEPRDADLERFNRIYEERRRVLEEPPREPR